MAKRSIALARGFLWRELRNRFAGSISGGLWALFQPLIQLAVYAFVFVHIFKARVPGADAPGYVPFLICALWPWTAFSEGLLRSTTVIHDNSALIGKVALPREILVISSVSASFTVHIAGFAAIVAILAISGSGIQLLGIVPAFLLYLPLFALAIGCALVLASMQVFVRDLIQVLAQLMTLMMFAAPIFYERSALPEAYRGWLDLNPFTFYAETFRSLLLGYGTADFVRIAIAIGIALIALFIGHRVFRRLDPHFEDFL